MNSDAFMDRLKKAIDKESNRSFAEKCGLSEGTVRRYLKGEAFPPLDTLQVIAEKSGCSLAWLASGEGDMRRLDKPSEEDKRLREQYPLSPLTAKAFGISDSQSVAYAGQKDHPYAWFHEWIDEELKGKSITEVMSLAVKIKAEIDMKREG